MSLSELNPSQREAVNYLEGPLLVLAGPGSGKTRVITRRVARLVEEGVSPGRILAITFTNKAAQEMENRVQTLLPGARVWVSTFHRLCARLLRRYHAAVGLEPNFTIYDTGDQAQVMRGVLNDLDIDPKHYPPGKFLHRIGQAKHKLTTEEQFARHAAERGGTFDQMVAKVYPVYQQALLKSNSVDFDDLLLHVCRLLSENEDTRAELDDRYLYVLVDEYQDTNLAQYQIVRMLSRDHPNLCATGDPDQSIYGWRGAELGNILRFEVDFPTARVVRLEQNYRSTQSILRAADTLISHNTRRKAKALFTDNPVGSAVESVCYGNQALEAEGIALLIRQLVEEHGRSWGDFAVFYRMNALSRGLELALTRHRIPYQVAAGVAFYERAEVKDVIAYLRLVSNPADRAAFLRIVNTPVRGIGKGTVAKVLGWADHQGITPLEAARRAGTFPGLTRRAVLALAGFANLIDEFSRGAFGGVAGLIEAILHRTRYGAEWKGSRNETDLQRNANVEELKTAARQYDEQHPDDATLEGFLETASLVADVDAVDELAGQVTLMTLHAAKGLEFPVVFIVAVEDGLLPHERSLKDSAGSDLEEERRLLFVGITRAKDQLFLTRTVEREFRGQRFASVPSRFLNNMDLLHSGGDNSDFPFGALAEPAPPIARIDAAENTGSDVATDANSAESAFLRPDGRGPAERPVERTRRQPAGLSALMTGAELLKGVSTAAEPSRTFAVGMSVRHPTFGLGQVLEAQGTGKWRTVIVGFREGEPRSFIVEKCPLQPVGR